MTALEKLKILGIGLLVFAVLASCTVAMAHGFSQSGFADQCRIDGLRVYWSQDGVGAVYCFRGHTLVRSMN